MTRVFNFSAGPAMLPEAVLKKAENEFMEYKNAGMSVMEMSHRSKDYMAIIEKAEKTLREIMNISDNYEVLFLQGGASSQFAMVPLNLFNKSKKCDAINTGAWTKKAIAEAKRYGTVNVIGDSSDRTFAYIPKTDKNAYDKDADYFYICPNNTIYGTKFNELPDTGKVPLVADFSSSILSEEIDVNKFGVIFAGAQKNIGPAGLTIVIIRKDLIGNAVDFTPTMFNYKTHADNDSMFNTPPTYAIYLAGLVFDWIKEQGGVKEIEAINKRKAAKLYDYLDNSKMFQGTADKECRSLMNVPFKTDSEELDAKFIKEAAANKLVNLKGHRSIGGMRASIYNAMPEAGIDKLIDVMKNFETNNS